MDGEEPKKELPVVCDRCFKAFPKGETTPVRVYGKPANYCKKCLQETT